MATSSTWYEDFSAADAATFATTAYAAQTDASKALYTILSGASTTAFSNGVMTMGGTSGVRITIGATDPATATTSTINPGGMFALSGKACTMIINAAAAQTAGLLQVYIDNNTTGAANSVLASASRVLNIGPANTNALAAGANSYTFTAPATTGSDFLYLRADSTASTAGLQINSISLNCL